jgi:hypothetical protein
MNACLVIVFSLQSIIVIHADPLWTADIVYHAKGTISLPYAEIFEPFEVWYDGKNNRSRQNYYNGMNNIIQRADKQPYGYTYKIVPETTDTQLNVLTCFGQEGTADFPVTTIQSVVPDTTNYKVRLYLLYFVFFQSH